MCDLGFRVEGLGSSGRHMSSILFGDTMVPNMEYDYILLLVYSILYKEYNLTRFIHQKKRYSHVVNAHRRVHEASPRGRGLLPEGY